MMLASTVEPWVIYLLVFGAILFGVQGSFLLVSRASRQRTVAKRQAALTQSENSPVQALDNLRHQRGFGMVKGIQALHGFETLFSQTGLRYQPARLLIFPLGLIIVIFLMCRFLFGLPAITAALLAIAISLASVYLLLLKLRRRRISRFSEQLPEALDVIIRGLRAGHPFRVSIGLVAREMPDPIGTEFGILADEIQFGLDANTALENLVERVGADDLQFLAVAINIQSRTGGSLAELLARLSKLVRSRATLRLKVRALSAEGRLSAVFLSLAPFVLFGVISVIYPDYFGSIRNHPVTNLFLAAGLALLTVGNIIMYRMVNFKV